MALPQLLSIDNTKEVVPHLRDRVIIDSYKFCPNYKYLAIMLTMQEGNFEILPQLQIYSINQHGDKDVICISKNLISSPLYMLESFMWSPTGKWLIISERYHNFRYSKFSTEVWTHAIDEQLAFNINNSKTCAIIQHSKSRLVVDNPTWLASINMLPCTLDYTTVFTEYPDHPCPDSEAPLNSHPPPFSLAGEPDSKREPVQLSLAERHGSTMDMVPEQKDRERLLFSMLNDITYKIYYLSDYEYIPLFESKLLGLNTMVNGFNVSHNTTEIVNVEGDSGVTYYIANVYTALFITNHYEILLYSTNINVFSDNSVHICNEPKLKITNPNQEYIPALISVCHTQPNNIIISYVSNGYVSTKNEYLHINTSTFEYKHKTIPDNLTCVAFYPKFTNGESTLCMLEGPDNICVNFNLLTEEYHHLGKIDTLSGFINIDLLFYKSTIGFGKIPRGTTYYKNVLEPDNWFKFTLPINNITNASSDSSTVAVCHNNKKVLSIKYTVKYCTDYNHRILTGILASVLPPELITSVAKYSLC